MNFNRKNFPDASYRVSRWSEGKRKKRIAFYDVVYKKAQQKKRSKGKMAKGRNEQNKKKFKVLFHQKILLTFKTRWIKKIEDIFSVTFLFGMFHLIMDKFFLFRHEWHVLTTTFTLNKLYFCQLKFYSLFSSSLVLHWHFLVWWWIILWYWSVGAKWNFGCWALSGPICQWKY